VLQRAEESLLHEPDSVDKSSHVSMRVALGYVLTFLSLANQPFLVHR
jgi:hypothetical protein